jgi:hypothetical protein
MPNREDARKTAGEQVRAEDIVIPTSHAKNDEPRMDTNKTAFRFTAIRGPSRIRGF